MTLSPEQFNLIATKEDIDRLENKVDNLADTAQQLLTVIDGLAKKVDDFQSELVSNQVAHDRFETRVTKLEEVVL